MTVVSTVVRAAAAWTGAETEIPTGIQVQERSQLVVSLVPDEGERQALTLGLHYAVTLSTAGVATVVPLAAFPATPGTVSMVRQTPMTQVYDPTATDTYDAAGHAAALDRSAMRVAELSQKVDDVEASSIVVVGGAASVPEGAVYVSNGEGGAIAGPTAAEIETARAGAVSAAESSAAGAQAAGASAMSAAASAAAAALFDPTLYYLKTAFKSDGTPNVPVKYDANGRIAVPWLYICGLNEGASGVIEYQLYGQGAKWYTSVGGADGHFYFTLAGTGTTAIIDKDLNAFNFTNSPRVGGRLMIALDADGRLPAYDGSKLTNLPIPGVGQTLTNVGASRSIGTWYQNTTNKVIFIYAQTTSYGGGNGIVWYLGPTTSNFLSVGTVMTNGWGVYSFIAVPPGHFYQMAPSNYNLAAWWEYR